VKEHLLKLTETDKLMVLVPKNRLGTLGLPEGWGVERSTGEVDGRIGNPQRKKKRRQKR